MPSLKTMTQPRSFWVEAAFLLLTPLAAYFLFDISLVNQDKYVDPWLYTGLGENFPLIYSLHGWSYYNVRFPVMFLNGLALSTPDPLIGFAMLRYGLLITCGIPLYLLIRRNYGVAVAVIAYLFLFCNSLFLRILLWDLTTFLSIPFALAGFALWLLPERPDMANRMLCGFLMCAAIASHAFTGSAVLIFLVLEALNRAAGRDFKTLVLLDVLATGAGAALCFAAGCLFYLLTIGTFNPWVIFSITAGAARVGNEYTMTHSAESLTWLMRMLHVFVPYILVAVGGVLLGRRILGDTVAARIWRFAVVYCAAYGIYQFGFGAFVLEEFYYFAHVTLTVYLLLPVCFALTLESVRNEKDRRRFVAGAVCIMVAFVGIPNLARTPLDDLQDAWLGTPTPLVLIAIMFVVAMILITIRNRRVALAGAAACVLMAMVQFATMLPSIHSAIYNNVEEERQHSVYRATLKALDIYDDYASPTQQTFIWFPSGEPTILSIGSAMMLFSLNSPWAEESLPAINDYERVRLTIPNLKYVMMMSENQSLLREGLEALEQVGLSPNLVLDEEISEPAYSLHVSVVEITPQVAIQ